MTVKKISKQEAIERKMFGPVYHGTHEAARDAISKEGFKVHIGSERSGDISHGYQTSSYAGGKPAPVHHIGYGVYMTTVKAIAKSFNGGTLKGLREYYLDLQRLETINFGAPGTMMKWWVQNGYNIPVVFPVSPNVPWSEISKMRVDATKHLTDKLKSKYDAVWFKGKGIRRLLDGDQIVVFDPSRIYEIDQALAGEFEIGSKIKRKSDGMIGVITNSRSAEGILKNYPNATWLKPETKTLFDVKWKKGGTQHKVQDIDVEAVQSPKGFKQEVSSQYELVEARDAYFKHITSEDLKEFMSLADSYEGWQEDQLEYYKENTPTWTEGWEDMDEHEREQKITEDLSDSENNEDSTMIFFRNPKVLPPNSWVVHFTDKDPREIHKNLKGCGGTGLGLTKHYGCKDGDLVFGLALDKVEGDADYHTYGKNAVLVQVGQAVEAEHISDDEQYQTVFDKTTTKKSYPIVRSSDKKSYEVYDNKGKLLFTQKRTVVAFKNIVKKVSAPSSLKNKVQSKYELVESKSRWLVKPPVGHEDLPTKMLLLRNNTVVVIDQKDNVERPGNTHRFTSVMEAQKWLDSTIDQLKKAEYKVI